MPGCWLFRPDELTRKRVTSITQLNADYSIKTYTMNHQVLFIQGGGSEEDYIADAKLVSSLREHLGSDYEVIYPALPNESAPDFGRTRQIAEQIGMLHDGLILAGHSLGASMLLKYLSENQIEKRIAGLFLIATPFWSGEEEWKQAFRLQDDFAEHLPPQVPVFLYHSRDDDEVSFDHLAIYQRSIPGAIVREIAKGGHQLGNNLQPVADDIRSL
jgi:uncharacterized protein